MESPIFISDSLEQKPTEHKNENECIDNSFLNELNLEVIMKNIDSRIWKKLSQKLKAFKASKIKFPDEPPSFS